MSSVTHSTGEAPNPRALPPAAGRHARPGVRARLAIALLLGALVALGWLAGPTLLWAYQIERAGRLLDQGLAWPAPRSFTSLPSQRDAAALTAALPLLEAATRQRPAHPHAYRLAGQVYAAQSAWLPAARAYEQALERAPANPLIRWEASLVYAQIDALSRSAARQPLADRLMAGRLDAPGTLVRSLFCNERGAASCYLGRVAYRQPYAADPQGPEHTADGIFLHPPASLTLDLALPAGRPGLSFLAGLDPVARPWASDGASFRVWATPPGGAPALVAELAIDQAAAREGWAIGWADLTPWAGQTIALTLEVGPGPAGDAADDWYAWGDLALTTADAAQYAALLPALRAHELAEGLR